MAKSNLNIVSVFTWLGNTLDTQILSSSEQLVLLHLVKYLNRNFWKAINLSNHKLASAIGKDDRTVGTAIKKLVAKGLVIKKGGELHLGIDGAEKYFSSTSSAVGESESGKAADASSDAAKSSESVSKVKTLADYF